MSDEIELPAGWMRSTLEDVAGIQDNLREPVNPLSVLKWHGPYPYQGKAEVGDLSRFSR